MSVDKDSSPFHQGEKAVQKRLGVRDQVEQFGRQVIRSFMPDQHREFYQNLPFILVGHADNNGWPWASFLSDEPGFIQSPDAKQLVINTTPVDGDPLNKSLTPSTPLGLLGIELPSRRRNRMAAHITNISNECIALEVDQSFGNCPQYIQARVARQLDSEQLPNNTTEKISRFNESIIRLITKSDTFFVASYVDKTMTGKESISSSKSTGVDVSHRGGQPGFVRVDDDRILTIPDFSGNNHFNTLGNFELNPKAGLLFLDFENHHMLTLTGTVEILWDDPDTTYFDGAQRLWQFKLDHGYWLKNSLAFEWEFLDASINNTLTGTWDKAEKRKHADQLRNIWLNCTVSEIKQESDVVKSFYLDTGELPFPRFKAGQFLTLLVKNNGQSFERNYTISSAPDDDFLRISVRREGNKKTPGVSQFLHDQIKVGDQIKIKSAQGNFIFDTQEERPAMMIAAGIGITPILSMLRDAIFNLVTTRFLRKLNLFLVARNQKERAFYQEIMDLIEGMEAHIQITWCLTQENSDLPDHVYGRLSRKILQSSLPLDDYDVYLCGPNGFMQDTYRILRDLSVQDSRIHAEAFGPAGLKRDKLDQVQSTLKETGIADQAIVCFLNEKGQEIAELAWKKEEGYLLDFAESHGLTPMFSCRSGQCGSCRIRVHEGQIVHDDTELVDIVSDKEALLCCGKPSKQSIEDRPSANKLVVQLQ